MLVQLLVKVCELFGIIRISVLNTDKMHFVPAENEQNLTELAQFYIELSRMQTSVLTNGTQSQMLQFRS